MKEFIFINWTSIAAILIGFINLLLIIFKKRIKVVDAIWSYILSMLPEWICSIERAGYTGCEKKEFVISYALRVICEHTGLDEATARSKYRDRISAALEDILACPQKKGVN